jgi:alpha-galactosidase
MARLLFKLAQVPDDEAQEIRELLTREDIRFYETDAGFFRVGLDAIWLADAEQEVRARELLMAYQQERNLLQQENYARLVEAGQVPNIWQHFCSQPLRFIALVVAIVFVVALTLLPFVMPALQ